MNEVLSQHDHGNCELCDQQEDRIRMLEAEVARLRENEYAVLHKGLDLMAWVKVAEAAQARVRELEKQVIDAIDVERSRCARLCWSWGESWMAEEIYKGEEPC